MTLFGLDGLQPTLPDGFSFVAESASVIGNVVIGEDVGIWFGVVIRGDNDPIVIGARSNIQDNSVIHTDPGAAVNIGEGCTIGHGAIIHGCVIGDNSLIGMGATVLNHVKIGRNCLIGAGALIKERTEIPDNSLVVGSPGKIIRQIDEAGVKGLKLSADTYVANARRFAKGLARMSQAQ